MAESPFLLSAGRSTEYGVLSTKHQGLIPNKLCHSGLGTLLFSILCSSNHFQLERLDGPLFRAIPTRHFCIAHGDGQIQAAELIQAEHVGSLNFKVDRINRVLDIEKLDLVGYFFAASVSFRSLFRIMRG